MVHAADFLWRESIKAVALSLSLYFITGRPAVAQPRGRRYNRRMDQTIVLNALLSDFSPISVVEHHTTIGSTNDRARELAGRGTPEIAVIVADEQTAGRGRQNRSWYTPAGTALAVSLLTRPAIAPQHAMRLTMLAGLAAVEGIEWATDLRLDLKWPNDVVTMNNDQLTASTENGSTTNRRPTTNNQRPTTKKVGGILTECAFEGEAIDYAVIGIGLNVNVDFSQQLELRQIATSLSQLAGREIDRWAVLKAIIAAWIDRYAWLTEEDRLREAWAARLINLRKNIRVNLNDQIGEKSALVEGYAEGVDHDGALLLRTTDGRVQRLLAGDVSLHNLNR
jgi:BirA family biotin operon repressor/biotin-[acetyl-CoA-carboxylase] ligase